MRPVLFGSVITASHGVTPRFDVPLKRVNCDGTSAVGESRHRIPGASVGQPTEPFLARHDRAALDAKGAIEKIDDVSLV